MLTDIECSRAASLIGMSMAQLTIVEMSTSVCSVEKTDRKTFDEPTNEMQTKEKKIIGLN
jgi:hypothetical protein